MNRLFLVLFSSVLFLPVFSCRAQADSSFFFFDRPADPLARRDDYGLLHQGPGLNPTDFSPRHSSRFSYYFESGERLQMDPAYVGALQVSLRDNGYYCGPIDGIFSDRVADAIARAQKNCSLRVTGTLTLSVRRALHLP